MHTYYGMNTDTKANPHKYAERKFQQDDEFFNDAVVLRITNKRWVSYLAQYVETVSYRIISGGFTPESEPIGSEIYWITDSGLGHRHQGHAQTFQIVGHIIGNELVGDVPNRQMPLYVFK